MVAFAYVLLPVSGLVAYMKGSGTRARLHGLQAIIVGVAWPAALYGASALSPGVTQVTFVVGIVVWVVLAAAAALGRDLVLPGLGGLLRWASSTGPRDRESGPAGEAHPARRRG
jgi:hypothetical protein